MNPEKPSREEIEAKLTALLLGELPAEEAQLLRWAISQDAGLAKLHDRLKFTIGLVREIAANPVEKTAQTAPLKLSDERREKLFAHFKTIAPRKFEPPKRREISSLLAIAAAMAIIALLAALLLPSLAAAKRKAQHLTMLSGSMEKEQVTVAPVAPQAVSERRVESVEANFQNNLQPQTQSPVVTTAPSAITPTQIVLPPSEPNAGVPAQKEELAASGSAPCGVANNFGLAGGGGGASGGDSFGGSTTFQGQLHSINRRVAEGERQDQNSLDLAFIGVPADNKSDDDIRGKLGISGNSGDNWQAPAPASAPTAEFGFATSTATKSLLSEPNNTLAEKGIVSGTSSLNDNGIQQSDQGDNKDRFFRNLSPAAAEKPPLPGDVPLTGNLFASSSPANQPGNIAAPINLSDDLPKSGNGAVTLNGANTFSGETTVVGGTFNVNPPASAINPSGQLPGNTAVSDSFLLARKDESGKLAVNNSVQLNRSRSIDQIDSEGLRQTPPVVVAQNQAVQNSAGESVPLAPPPTDVAPAAVTDEADRPLPKIPESAPVPQPEIQTSDNSFSTFSLNVSDVSFKLAAASLQNGVMPEAASIRSEEFINAFDYRDPEPAPGVPMTFFSERARYPFAHNRDLLRFSVKTAAAGRQPGRPLNLVLLLDNSGSMERADRVAIIHEALKVLATQLQPQDTISIVTFARTARLWVDGASGDQAGTAVNKVMGLTPEGGTNLEEAMNLAYATARRHYLANGVNRVVLLTDGAANLGDVDPDALKQKVETFRKQGIALDCFGIGWEGYNDDLLEVLSSNGDGRYGFINTPEEAATDFVGQLAGALHVAAEDVKVQVEFNPQRVISWRQIGYAKHQLTKEQFRDNSVAAAPLAAREAGNALYTVEVNPQGEGPVATVRVRFRVPGTADYDEREWQVPFNGTAPAFEQSSAAMRLAATAGAFSEWLASSPFAQEVTTDQLLNDLNGVPQIYGADERPEKLEWMIRQAKSLSGK